MCGSSDDKERTVSIYGNRIYKHGNQPGHQETMYPLLANIKIKLSDH